MSLLRKKDVSVMMDMKQHSKLARHLSGFDLILLGIGAIIGTGIFVLTGTGALYAGPALPISFIISAVVCALAALCYAEFSSMIPVSGS
ncbi:MAG: amino acid permease, partial [Exiguobacterium sp.]